MEQLPNHEQQDQGCADRPAIWVGALAAYNDGELHGAWLSADRSEDELNEAIQDVLKTSPVEGEEEWFIADFDNFGSIRIGEYTAISTVAIIGEAIAEHGPAVTDWIDHAGYSTDEELMEAIGQFEDAYLGEHESFREYLANYLTDAGIQDQVDSALKDLPEYLRGYLRWEMDSYERDMAADLLVVDSFNGKVRIFNTSV